jgi:hypothetical protein
MIWRNRFPRIPSRSPQILGNRGGTHDRRRTRIPLRVRLGLRQMFAHQTLVVLVPNRHCIWGSCHRTRKQVYLYLRLGTRIVLHTLRPCTEHRNSLLGI